ncbi:hypothetical protein [Polyangium jinanense]|uniref:Uncharacterized protein n=1 Tax=Polyangium jinanense TaxID=2829994 RepID=A0A9X3XB24_9BACT|nr:hypothetical protein [Polyangium jinanense]MDC3985960.1 hypothetical protein [Polyangium jinanense]
MADVVTEAFLEMHFARALAELFASVYGARFLRLWKPSPNGETYVGFDQGWVRHSGTDAEFEKALRDAISTRSTSVPKFFVGYFMQFKRVQQMQRSTKFTDPSIQGEHLRVEIDLVPSPTTGISQHDTLIRLANIQRADVSYACGMIFDAGAIYDTPDLSQLRIVPVDDKVVQARARWQPGERHFIEFQSENAAPLWCSEPVPGRALSPEEWARELRHLSARDVLGLLAAAREALGVQARIVPYLTVLEFEAVKR